VKETARRVRRALVERPVVYAADLDDHELVQLALPRTAADVELLTGLVAERREEGVAMIDSSGRLSDVRFPGTGTVAQVALLLAGEIADRVLDPDAPETARMPLPRGRIDDLIEQVDSAIPQSGIFDSLAGHDGFEPADPAPADRLFPLVEDEWIAGTVRTLTERFGRTFAAGWQADPDGLGRAALALLERLRLTAAVPGGVLALPALARYRGVVVTIRDRTPEIDLFQSSANDSEEVTA